MSGNFTPPIGAAVRAIDSGFAAAPENAVPTKQGSNIPFVVPFGQPGMPAFTVATLPTGALGRVTLCTDCLTTIGTGSVVFWDGATWRTAIDGVPPTTSLLQFFRSLVRLGTVQARSNRCFFYLNEYFGNGSELPSGATTSGAGANSANWAASTGSNYGALGLATGTTATGFAIRAFQSGSHPIPTSGTSYFAVRTRLPVLPSSAEDFVWRVGVSNSGTAITASSVGIELLCDRFGAGGYVVPSGSPNWIVRGANGGTPQFIDTGVPLGTSNVNFEFLATATQAECYLDGVLVGTLTTVPTTNYSVRHSINKLTAGVGISRQGILEFDAFGVYFGTEFDRFTV